MHWERLDRRAEGAYKDFLERIVRKMAGKIKNCPVCGKLYAEMGRKMCPDCYEKYQEKEHAVLEYVRDHKGAKITEIVEATGASEKMINRMIREGRFEQVGVRMGYPCEKCGTMIYTGKLCMTCQEKIHEELQATQAKVVAKAAAAAPSKPAGKKGGMYTTRNF